MSPEENKETHSNKDVRSHKKESKDDSIEIPVGKYLGNFRKNPWILSTIILCIVLIVVLIVGRGFGNSAASVSSQVAGASAVAFLNSNPNLQGTVELVSSEVANDIGNQFYKVTVRYQGKEVPVYTTLDGKFLVANIVPLSANATAPANDNTNGGTQTVVNLTVGDSPVIGEKTAKVTIIEFADFSCPFCGAASGDAVDVVASMKQRDPSWEAPVPGIMKDYVKTGKVRFAYKFFYGHTGGKPAFLVGLCMNDQNLFWKFHESAFAHQSDVEDLSKMKDLAKGLGANMATLNSCLDSKKYDARIDAEQQEGVAAGVQGTPAFFVNGELVSGAVSYAQMKQVIDAELAKLA